MVKTVLGVIQRRSSLSAAAFTMAGEHSHENQRLNSQISSAVPNTDTSRDPRQPSREEKRANIVRS
jgi:hypothetical protein